MNEEVKDIYNSKDRYESWLSEVKEAGIQGISKKSCDLLFRYIKDMELGQNIGKGSRKGGRSHTRLNTLRIRLTFLIKILEARNIKDIEKATSHKVSELFNEMRSGEMKRKDGTNYKSVADYVKVFKAFWHWLMKIRRKEGIELKDITEDLDTSYDENSFVYIEKSDLDKMLQFFTPDEQIRILFMYDTIIRSPTELMNVKRSDFSEDFKELRIRDETSKTFGRQIKILLCSEELKKYAERNEIKENDFMFVFSSTMFNEKLKKIAKEVLGDKMSKGGKKYSSITMYDFRHSGACYWRTGAYKTKIDALMYRGGWNDLSMLNYYTKKIGMKDTIEKDDMLIEADKHMLEKKLEILQKRLAKFEKIFEASKEHPVLITHQQGKYKKVTGFE